MGCQPVACPLLDLRPDFPAERGLLVPGDVQDFGGSVFNDGVGDDLDKKGEPVIEFGAGKSLSRSARHWRQDGAYLASPAS